MTGPSRARLKHVGLIAAKVLAGVLGGLALLVGIVLSVLQTDWGGERLRRSLVKRVNTEIRGQLDVGRLTFRTNGIALSGVRLSDPAGRSVALVGLVRVQFRMAALLRKEIHVTNVLLDRPALNLISEDGELNLSQALEARHPKPRRPPAPKRRTTEEGWVFRLDRFDLHEGSVQLTTIRDETSVKRVALAQLETTASVRYATGNGNLQTHLRFGGDHTVDPLGSFDVQAEATIVTGSTIHVAVNGHILNDPLLVRVDMKPGAPETLDGEMALSVAARAIRGSQWGPLRIEGRARPGQAPKLNVAIAIPGIELTGKSESDAEFDFKGALTCRNLATTAAAISALTGGEAGAFGGSGRLNFAVGGHLPAGKDQTPSKGQTPDKGQTPAAPANWHATWDGLFERLNIGTTEIRGFSLAGRFQHPEVELRAGITAPEPLKVAIAGNLDGDRRGLTLRELSVDYPQGKWALQKPVRLRSDADTASMSALRLASNEQVISIEGSRTAEDFRAALAIERFRLDRLPALLVPAEARLAGIVDVTATAAGRTDDPNLHANVSVNRLRFQNFNDVQVEAHLSMAEQRIAGAVDVRAPFAALDANFETTTTPLEPGTPLMLSATLSKLDLGGVLTRVQRKASPADGAITSHLRVRGSVDDPSVDLTVTAARLRMAPPQAAGTMPATAPADIDIGQARLHLTYDDRVARTNVTFSASHGGDLKADASAKIDLSYPRVKRLPKATKIPIEGKVVARDFDVAWVAGLSDRIQTMSGRVAINAKLAGTVADPQFLGDVRWKEGHLVTTAPERAAPRPPAASARPKTEGRKP